MKKLTAVALLLLLLIVLLPVPSTVAQPTQPVGSIAVKMTGVPSATGYLGFGWLGFVQNATSSTPTAVTEQYQLLSADANKTLQADPIQTALSKLYALDYDPYVVDAYNDTLNFKASGIFNITLGNHFIEEGWVVSITITVYANTSIYPDTEAHWYIYNFTAGSWITLGTLNATDRTSATWTITADIGDYVDEANGYALMLKYNYTDTTNTDFTLHIDYLEVNVTYQVQVRVADWATTQVNSTVYIGKPGAYSIAYWTNATLTLPSTLSGSHNFTVYMMLPDKARLANHRIVTNATEYDSDVSDSVVYLDVAMNSSKAWLMAVNYLAENIVKTEEASAHEYAGESKWYNEYRATNQFTELVAENLVFVLYDYENTDVCDVHREATDWKFYVNGTEVTPLKVVEEGVKYWIDLDYIQPGENKVVRITESLPKIHVVHTNGYTLDYARFNPGTGALEYWVKATKNTVVNITVYAPKEPGGVYSMLAGVYLRKTSSYSDLAKADVYDAWFYNYSTKIVYIETKQYADVVKIRVVETVPKPVVEKPAPPKPKTPLQRLIDAVREVWRRILWALEQFSKALRSVFS